MSDFCYKGQYIVVFGTASLQRYIFQSNRLKENIGASYLAKYWLEERLIKTVSADKTKWKRYETNPLVEQPKEPVNADANTNVIYVGGGKAALLCQDRNSADRTVEKWSRELLKEAPGLRVTVGLCKVTTLLRDAYRNALEDLAQCEEALPFGAPLYSLPVVRTCTNTGLPAGVLSKEDKEWISGEAASKRKVVGSEHRPGYAQKAISKEFASVLAPSGDLPQQRFAIELEDLGGYAGESHIAIVHADGNGMGDKLMRVIDDSEGNDDFLHNLRRFSASVTDLSKTALQKTLEELKGLLPLKSLRNPEAVFPLRPIVYGGDDLTFVCDGRVGLHLAALYLKKFKGEIPIMDSSEFVSACAGVVIVPTKFPFARAYQFAEELCGLAKAERRKKNRTQGTDTGSWLDFQIIQEGATKSIKGVRETQYLTITGQKLHKRPYQVPETWNDSTKSDTFIQILKWFQSSKWPRSRAKNLLQALVQGPSATKRFLDGVAWRGIELPLGNQYRDGWETQESDPNGRDNDRNASTPCYDPIEAIDFYLPELL